MYRSVRSYRQYVAGDARHLSAVCGAVLMLCAFFLYSHYTVVWGDHDCQGDDCPFCAIISTVRSEWEGLVVHRTLRTVLCSFSAVRAVYIYGGVLLLRDTPVTQKVKLNN
ncbi:MAG: hypothetical protein IJ191_04275 [Treponema sp.]|nr:hypothetical protein [Treponema sp.]